MKTTLFFLLLFFTTLSFSQSSDTSYINFEGHQFYHIRNKTNSKVLIFLHGGVSNPKFSAATKVDLKFIFEDNDTYINTAQKMGFDLLIPITNDSLNWLTNHQFCFEVISRYLENSNSYNSRVITGFSDGGTGSFKLFYDNPKYFDGLVVFNGYPQHQNFYLTVDYEKVKDKKIIFFSTFKDKVIPYEFLMTEYYKQKSSNPNTYLYIKKGSHSFSAYTQKEIDLCFEVLNSKTTNIKTAPIHAFIKEDQVIEFYCFRKKIYSKFGYGKEDYLLNKKQRKLHTKK